MSPAATLHRIGRLKESGVIRIISAQLDPAPAGETNYLLTVVARDVAELQTVLASLATRGGQRLVTYLRLGEIKPHPGYRWPRRPPPSPRTQTSPCSVTEMPCLVTVQRYIKFM